VLDIPNYYSLFGINIVFGRGSVFVGYVVSTVLTDGAVMWFMSLPLTRLEWKEKERKTDLIVR